MNTRLTNRCAPAGLRSGRIAALSDDKARDIRESFIMKIISHTMCLIVAIAVSATTGSAAGHSEKKMLAEAKVDRTHAERIAIGAAHGGNIKSGEIERGKGHLVWSFDIVRPNTSTITEVLIDAATGKVVSVQNENAAKEAAEARAQARKKH